MITAWVITLAVGTVALWALGRATDKLWAIAWAMMAAAMVESFWFAVHWRSVAEACRDSNRRPEVRQLPPQQFQQSQLACFLYAGAHRSGLRLAFASSEASLRTPSDDATYVTKLTMQDSNFHTESEATAPYWCCC
jgi:hypothetical protein